MIRCIATDMDGTLLGSDLLISQKNLEAIKTAQEKGVEVVIATGRSLNGAKYPLENANLQLPMIVMNGAQIYDLEEKLLFSVPIPKDKAKKVIEILRTRDLYFEFYSSEGQISAGMEQVMKMYSSYKESQLPADIEMLFENMKNRFETLKIKFLDNFEEVFDRPEVEIYKFIVFSLYPEELKRAGDEIAALSDVVVSSSHFNNIEVNHVQAQKGFALERFLQERGYSLEETMAIGDSYNDLSMLKKAGFSVAMGNAAEDIKNAADFVTDRHDQDGFAKAVYRALELK